MTTNTDRLQAAATIAAALVGNSLFSKGAAEGALDRFEAAVIVSLRMVQEIEAKLTNQ